MDYAGRQKNLLKLLRSNSLDGMLVRKKQNISYLTGVKGDDAILFISGKGCFLITDSRYKEEYAKSVKKCSLIIVKGLELYGQLEEIFRMSRSHHIGFESDNFSYAQYANLKKRISGVAFKPTKDIVESLRTIKDSKEVHCVREACKKASAVMGYALRAVRVSLSEHSIKQKIQAYLARKGIESADFDFIVASGKNASMPHASTSQKKIKKQEMVVIDLGAMDYGYNSDLTRTVYLGRIDRKYLRIYNIVRDAQKKAIENIKAGVKAKYIDGISRQYISKEKLGKYFIHSLGHGVGLEVHENPRISKNSPVLLERNMIITIEPGVYIPGWGGVRVEDVVLVTEDGCEVLTGAPK